MSKDIKDYLHLYLGCRFVMKINGTDKLTGDMMFGVEALHAALAGWHDTIYPILILRPLSDMKQDEYDIIEDVDTSRNESHTEESRWEAMAITVNKLRQMGFDCDRLIESGLAIDKTKQP